MSSLRTSQKIAAQALPVIGALGGGAVNYAFVSIFRMWHGAISPLGGSSGFTTKSWSEPNMIELIKIPEYSFAALQFGGFFGFGLCRVRRQLGPIAVPLTRPRHKYEECAHHSLDFNVGKSCINQ